MRRIFYFFLLLSCGTSYAESHWNASPIKVEIYDSRKVFGLVEVEVVSLIDNILIENVSLNQGECELDRFAQVPPITLTNNQKATFEAYTCFLEELGEGKVEIQTNLGTWINNQFTPIATENTFEEESDEFYGDGEDTLFQSFEINGKSIQLLHNNGLGSSCPGGTFQFVDIENNYFSESFGTCTEDVDVRQKGDKIIVTMRGFQNINDYYNEEEIKDAEKASEEIWQYIYHNQQLEQKQLH